MLQVDTMKEFYRHERKEIEKNFHAVYTQAVNMAERIGSQPEKPRSVQRQRHRSNVPASTPEDYYRKNTAIPFLDHLTTQLDAKFSGKSLNNIS